MIYNFFIFEKIIFTLTYLLYFIAVCGTTRKRKACKNCTCGLAEELNTKNIGNDTTNAKSNCGNVSNIK